MAASIGTLKAMLVLDTKGFIAGFGKAQSSLRSFASATVARAGAAIASVAGITASFQSLGRGMAQVDRQAKLADRLGITVGEVQKLSLAADLAGTDVEVLAKAMLKMGKNIGSGGMTLDKRLFEVADAIANIQDAGERARRAESIFGRGGLEIINTLIQGGRGIRNSAEAIDKFGLALSRADAAKIEAVNDQWTEMTTILGGLRNLLIVELAPQMNKFLTDTLIGLEVSKKEWEMYGASIKAVVGVLTGAEIREWIAATAGTLLTKGSELNVAGTKAAMDAQRNDASRNAAQSGRVSGSALLGKSLLGGGSGPKTAGVFERGTMEAAKAIAGAGGSPLVKIGEQQLKVLSQIERHEAAAARKKSEQPLRASALRGGGI